MSRAIRRQQKAAEAKQTTSSTTPRSFGIRRARAPRGTARPQATAGRRFRLRAPLWVQDIVSELKKVTWPTREETVYLTTVVIIVSISVGAVLGGIDLLFNWLIDRLLLR